ncbi:MAG: hypothetical protein JSV04_04090 [Candidatus Heimdallarchaeota archaeon]|nr:MAG: hypothetical protein JSV04_04090 [Candidatus Heimdallarchaeota archaeon]
MGFFRKRFGKSKTKQVRSESELSFQKGLDLRKEAPELGRPVVKGRLAVSLKGQITLLEEKLNTPDTRSEPPRHIEVIRKLADYYLKLGEEDFNYYLKAENLYKQFNVLYPLHMEKIDWLVWIEASAKAKLIREARRLLEEARMLFPGDKQFDDIETRVLHISGTS